MTRDELRSILNAVATDYESYRDGSYALVAALTDLKARFTGDEQQLFREYLLKLVAKKDSKLWGIALEVLITDKSEEVPQSLERMVRSGRQDAEWAEQLILALLRRGHDALDIYVPHIQQLIENGRPVCGELANLYRISPDVSLKMSAAFLAGELSFPGSTGKGDHCLTVFVHNFPKWDDQALAKLVTFTGQLDADAANKLRSLLVNFLQRSWVIKHLGVEKQQAVMHHLLNEN